ncbi:MAG TPA: SurA N-terminal domain-containing protein, partial [Anaerolineae bacterium]
MAKQKDQSSKTPTRKQIAISRREREQVRRIYIGLGLVIGLVVLVLAYGLIQTYFIEPNSPIATVDGDEIIVKDYRNRVNYERFLLEDQFNQLNQQQAALAQSSQDDQFTELLASQFQQQANQILQQLSIVDHQTLDIMVEDKLIRIEAEQRGLTVTNEEVTEYIDRFLARRLGGFTAASASETATARVDASATAALWTPT